jgi:hypothetical protein
MRGRLAEIFGADVRALATLRVGLGVLLLVDLGERAGSLVAHYTDAGVLSRADLVRLSGRRAFASVYLLSGTWEGQALLFVVAAVCAVALLVGYRTTLATVASWIFFMSVNARNPGVVYGFDGLLRVVLFWAMFLPLGACWSVDTRRSYGTHGPSRRVLSAGTVAYLVQIALVYLITGFRKSAPEWRTDGTALYYALSIDQLVTPLGHQMLAFPSLLKALTPAVLWLELLGPFLLFAPVGTVVVRTFAVLAFVLLHVGIGLTLHTGLFPWISLLALVPFLPSKLWDRLGTWARVGRGAEDDEAGERPATSMRSRLVSLIVAGVFAYIIVWGVSALPSSPLRLPPHVRSLAFVMGIDQTWNMFAPAPLKDDGWYVIPGRLASGEVVDLFRGGGAVRWDKPEPVAATFPSTRWMRYMNVVRYYPGYAPGYARYLCQRWNDAHGADRRLQELEIVFMLEWTLPDYRRSEPRRESLYRHTCSL